MQEEDVRPINACAVVAKIWLLVNMVGQKNFEHQARESTYHFINLWHDSARVRTMDLADSE